MRYETNQQKEKMKVASQILSFFGVAVIIAGAFWIHPGLGLMVGGAVVIIGAGIIYEEIQ